MVDAADQAIKDFAQHLVPEAFTAASSAYRVEVIGRETRPGGFAEWLERCKADAIAASYVTGGGPSGVVFVQHDDARWRWDQEPCCDLEWLTARVSNEVAVFAQPWAFVCSLQSRDRAVESDQGQIPGTLSWTFPWYAEARSARLARVFSGADEMCGSEVVATGRLSDSSRFVRAARRVLVGHPSRRAYRLR